MQLDWTVHLLEVNHNIWYIWEEYKTSPPMQFFMSLKSTRPSLYMKLNILKTTTTKHLTLLLTWKAYHVWLQLWCHNPAFSLDGSFKLNDLLLWPTLLAENKDQFVGCSSFNEQNRIQLHTRHWWSLLLWGMCAWWVLLKITVTLVIHHDSLSDSCGPWQEQILHHTSKHC